MQVSLNVYDAAANEGSASFPVILSGALGSWVSTKPDHNSYPEFYGCQNDNKACWSRNLGKRGFGINPGRTFGSQLSGTWVAPVAGRWLIRIALSCDVPFFADVESNGCQIDGLTYGCTRMSAARQCASALQMTVTEGAYFNSETSAQLEEMFAGTSASTITAPIVTTGPAVLNGEVEAQAAQMFAPTMGEAERIHTIVVSRQELEAQAAQMFGSMPATSCGSQLQTPPTLPDMMVAGSEASAMLAQMFTVEQQPHVAFPIALEPLSAQELAAERAQMFGLDGGGKNGRRRQQSKGPASQGDLVAGVRLTLKAKAPTAVQTDIALAQTLQWQRGDQHG